MACGFERDKMVTVMGDGAKIRRRRVSLSFMIRSLRLSFWHRVR
jgi:hypothetical protein